jgi:hypothetical protein
MRFRKVIASDSKPHLPFKDSARVPPVRVEVFDAFGVTMRQLKAMAGEQAEAEH